MFVSMATAARGVNPIQSLACSEKGRVICSAATSTWLGQKKSSISAGTPRYRLKKEGQFSTHTRYLPLRDPYLRDA